MHKKTLFCFPELVYLDEGEQPRTPGVQVSIEKYIKSTINKFYDERDGVLLQTSFLVLCVHSRKEGGDQVRYSALIYRYAVLECRVLSIAALGWTDHVAPKAHNPDELEAHLYHFDQNYKSLVCGSGASKASINSNGVKEKLFAIAAGINPALTTVACPPGLKSWALLKHYDCCLAPDAEGYVFSDTPNESGLSWMRLLFALDALLSLEAMPSHIYSSSRAQSAFSGRRQPCPYTGFPMMLVSALQASSPGAAFPCPLPHEPPKGTCSFYAELLAEVLKPHSDLNIAALPLEQAAPPKNSLFSHFF